jgi:hypothetical protein
VRPLYLHETIDIVGENAVPYMERSVLGFRTGTADRGLQLYGTWYVMGSTGRWPQVVNLWEMTNGWDDWERLCRSTNLRREANEELSRWWREAYERRSGGFDRLLGAVEGTRTLADLARQPVKGTVFVHELTSVRPGAGPDYLAAVRDEWAPVAAEHDHFLVGLWEVLMGDTEVCTLWATTLEAHVEMARSADATRGSEGGTESDDRIGRWRERARAFTTRWREELMVPCPGTPMGPDGWEGVG